ncbi:MAG: ABC transporter ATP-binding protein [Lactococcus raffinolactis]|jgi:putative ABC transport system ATP-binding protein|uniref:ABC transporter ATP-binding protein n=1 Tax=Pseudolactococcus raffinolactis TaxID=1366 RepID=UPI0011095E5C|nr:ABC transporter ATP-binding protein [Lactococcus raffinolactis]MBW9298746.1 ABC transporter ATP-binding protein [Lactococcus raffinolactis]MBW9330250.1 ABC transporter ATP-binding protein [Lactococcus raffinolactis]MCH4162573.1 ABC transporter ATP-binding protein [Lactococcus raffinolactis]MDN5472595.1 ABC transporter ATP-binding protein [Lactococcus raffinolactis]MDN5495089.1 ABC transporter ATP-binding protein [Lactococcus raffinolactis]
MAYIEFNDIVKTYQMGEVSIQALDHAQFDIEQGELVCILGPSGAGKTTALNILGGMDSASSGQVLVDGIDITQLKNKALVNYRRNDIGFVFQFYNLIQNLTALENVEMAVQLTKDSFSPAETLEKVGLAERQKNFPAQLSGGEQQRVAIARALAKNPKLLLCDEPTGALDYHTGKQILSLLVDTCRKEKITVIIITHNSAIGQIADKVIKFKNGRVESIQSNDQPLSVEAIEW